MSRKYKPFDPPSLSHKKLARLETLLAQLEIQVAERGKYLFTGKLAALNNWLQDPNLRNSRGDLRGILNAIPADSRQNYLQRRLSYINSVPGTEDLAEKLKALPEPQLLNALCYMDEYCDMFLDPELEQTHWDMVEATYREILSSFPTILNNADDLAGAEALGKLLMLNTKRDQMFYLNRMGNTQEKVAFAKNLLAQAYPNDDVSHIHVTVTDMCGATAMFMGYPELDTIICSPRAFHSHHSSPTAMLVFLFIHEFQHRRQLRLVERLNSNQLTLGSAEYYQARLMRENFSSGGYLIASVWQGKEAMIIRQRAYLEQPNEEQANKIALLASKIGQTWVDQTWTGEDKESKRLSDKFRNAAAKKKRARKLAVPVLRKTLNHLKGLWRKDF